MNPDLREDDSLALLGATLLDAPYVILLDDADDEGLKKVRCAAVTRLLD
jgi:hypothetical protein